VGFWECLHPPSRSEGKSLSNNGGITKGYPRLRKYFGRLMSYIQLCRVFTGLAPLAAGLLGVLAPVESVTFEHVKTAVYVGVTLMLLQFCGQCLNQYVDVEMDKLSQKNYRPLPSGQISREEALGISWLLAIFAVGRGFTISVFFGLITLLLLFFSVFYSLSPFSPRRVNPLLNTGWMAFSRGFIPVFAVWSVYGTVGGALSYAVLAFVWMMGFQGTKDIVDAEVDRKFGIKTVVNTYGIAGLKKVMWSCIIVYVVLAFYWGKFLILSLVPLGVACTFTNERKLGFMENVTSWVLMYVGLALFYVLMFLSTRFF